MADDLALALVVIDDAELESRQEQGSVEFHHPSSCLLEGGTSDGPYDQLEQAMAETDRCRMAERDVLDAIRRAQRECFEKAQAKAKEELEKLSQQENHVMGHLCIALEGRSSLEMKIANSNEMIRELEQNMVPAMEQLEKYNKERDELQLEHDDALKLAEELKKKQEDVLNTLMPLYFSLKSKEQQRILISP